MAKKSKKTASESDAGIEKSDAKTYVQRVKELGEAIISGLTAMGFTDVKLGEGDDCEDVEQPTWAAFSGNEITAKYQGAIGRCKVSVSRHYYGVSYKSKKSEFPEIVVRSSPSITYKPTAFAYHPSKGWEAPDIESAKPLNIKSVVERIAKTLHEDIADTNAEFNKCDKRLKALKIAHSFNESIQCDALTVDNAGNIVIRLCDTIRENDDIEALKIVVKKIVNGGLEFLFSKQSQSLKSRIDEAKRLLSHYSVELGKQSS